MKKTYFNPEMEVIKIETQGMLAMSKFDTPIEEPLSRGVDDDWEL